MKNLRNIDLSLLLRTLLCLGVCGSAWATGPIPNVPLSDGDPVAYVEDSGSLLDDNCVISILNRTIQVSADGGWSLPNLPANQGAVRARATCSEEDGTTLSGQSDYFNIIANAITRISDITFQNLDPIPTNIQFTPAATVVLDTIGATSQFAVTASYADGSTANVTAASTGTSYSSTNPSIATVSPQGLVTAVGNGLALITARKDGALAARTVQVVSGGDLDGDGLPDDYELTNGLNPNDPIDALEDQDGDALSALSEFNAGTNPRVADTDRDGVEDGEELAAGDDGFVTNPLLADSDGDGLSDGVEIAVGSDPNDDTDTDIEAALVSLRSIPASVVMTFNGIDSEVSTQLTISGVLVDGSLIDLTAAASTSYASSDLSVVSFGLTKGEIFGGQPGTATVTATSLGKSVTINVTVRDFEASALSAVAIPGYANNVDISGDYAFVAAGAAGLQVVDVSDRVNPQVVAALDTDGTSIDIKVVGNLAYIADGEAGLKVVDVTDPLAPVLVGAVDTAGVAQDVFVQLSSAYVANGAAGIEIFDISEAGNPLSIATLANLGEVTGISVEQDLAVVTGGSALIAIDVSDPASPIRLGSVNIGSVKDVELENGYAHVAAYSQGYRVVDMSNPMLPRITGGDSSIAPRDVALTRNFAFYAEQLFPNVIAFINIFDLENPIFQGTINLSPFGDYAGTGIALDASYAYVTEESFVVSSDYQATGNTRLFIAQYRDVNDNNGVPPTVSITSPTNGSVVVEGRKLVVTADAQDDVAVANVGFYVNGELVFTDTSSPYQVSITVPAPTDVDLVIEARAVDLGGNTATSGQFSLEVQPDADADGLGDAEEVDTWNTDPQDPDSDDDGLKDGEEIRLGTNPNNTDSDDDGIDDKAEVDNATDPLNPDVTPPTVSAIDPADGATDIPENNSITVLFNEPLLPKSINAGVLQVIPDGSATPIAGTLQLTAGNTELLFVPAALMQDFKLHTVAISGVRDAAGNVIAAVQRSFTTGNFVDTVRPSVLEVSPANNDSDVPLNSLIDVILSEPIIPATVTDNTFYVIDRSTNQRFAGAVSVSDDKTSISFVPNSPFLVGRQYQVVLTSEIQDLFGLALFGQSSYFTTSFASDGQGPVVVATTLGDGASQVPTNTLLRVQFSEVISALYISEIKLFDDTGVEIPVVRSLSNDKKTVTLDPVPVLATNESYVFAIDGVHDLSGNLLPNPVQVDFTTGADTDTTTGGIVNWSYASGAVLPLNAVLEVELSERIDPTLVNTDPATGQASFALYSSTQNRFLRGHGELSADGRHLRFARDEALLAGHQYYLYVTYNTYLFDLAGNRLDGTSRAFTTSGMDDTTTPVVTDTSLPDGAVDVAVNSRFIFSTDEALSDSCLNRVALLSDGVPVAASVALAADRRTITVTPTASLSTSAQYSLSLDGLCDYAGNALVTTVLSFTTAASDVADTTGPAMVSSVPASNATEVAVATTITLTYDEALSLLTAPVVTGAGITVPGDYAVSGNTVTFTPAIALLGSTQYNVDTTAVDRSGNSRSSGSFRFTTSVVADNGTPTVVAISPEANAIDVSPVTSVVLTFSEPMAPATLTNANIALYANGTIISPNVFRSADGREVTLMATLPSESVVGVAITSRVTDLSGNAMAPYVSVFTTSVLNTDGGRPSVSRVLPGNGSSNWLGINEVVMYLNEPLDTGSVEGAFHIAQNGTVIDDEGVLEVLGNGQTVRFTKNTPFAEGALVQVYLSDAATDLSNNPLNNFSAYFYMGTTSDGVGVNPTPQAFSPYSGSQNVVLNPTLQVLWSEPLDPASLTDSTVWLAKDYNGAHIPVTISLNTAPGDVGYDTVPGQIMTVVPSAALEVPSTNQIYYLRLEAGITDTDGDTVACGNCYYQYIYTGPTSVVDDRTPLILALNPPDGESGVGTNPYYAVRFDEAVSNFVANAGLLGQTNSIQFSENNQVVRYERTGTLPANTAVTETLPTFSDQAGNAVAGSTTFTTAAGPDLTTGSLVATSVINGATGVAQNPVLVHEFSEPIDPVSVSPSGVYLYDSSTGLNVPTSLDLSADGRRLTLVPVAALAPGRLYYWYAYSLRDLSGNGMSSAFTSFTTGFEDDSTGPLFEKATLFDGQTAVPTNVRVSVRFDEPLNPVLTAGVQLQDAGGTAVSAAISFSSDRRTVTLVPRSLLAANSSYLLAVAGVQDISGNPLLAPVALTFTTGDSLDSVSGNILTWSYASNAVLPLNAVLEVELSERIDPTLVNTDPATSQANFALYSYTQNRFMRGHGELSADGRHLRFVRDEALQAGHSYVLYVTYNTYLFDLAGNRLNGTNQGFTTSGVDDTTTPVVTDTSLPDGAVDVAVNSRFIFSTDEALSDSCLNRVALLSDGVPVAASVALAADRRTITVTPTASLSTSAQYSLSLDGLCDYAGNALVTTVLSFTTAASDVADTTGPAMVSSVPASNATEVAVATTITLTYDEALSLLTAPVVTGAGITVPGDYAVSGNTVTFTPAIALLGSTQYNVDTTAVDRSGNSRSSGSFRFTTSVVADNGTPTVVAISPEANAIDVSPVTSVVLTFSEPMAPATLTNANIALYANGTIISPNVFRSADGREVTLMATLPSESVVGVAITSRVTDLSGNAMAPYVSVFTTSVLNTDGGRPSVSRVLPGNGSSNWLGINEVVMYLNEPLDTGSVEGAFHIAQNGVVIDDEGVLEVLGNGQTVRFTKDTPFAEGALVQVYLSDAATDLSNNPLNNFSAYFYMGTTSDGVGVNPTPQAFSPNYSQNVVLNPTLQVLWSEPLDPASLKDSTVWLEKNYNGAHIPVTVSLNTAPGDVGYDTVPGQIMTVVPSAALEVPVEPSTNQIYYLRLEAGITDTDGDTVTCSSCYYLYFYTGPDSVVDDRTPLILALNPPEGESDVGTNPYYAVRFDEAVSSFVANAGLLGQTNSIQFSENNQVVRYERTGTLPANSAVTETLPTFSDQAGNAVAGSTTFTTAAGPDLGGGSIVTTSVANGATGVAQNPVLVREFSEPIDPVSVSPSGVYLYDSSTGLNVPTSLDLSADGRHLTLVPVEALAPGRLYYWYAFSLRDVSGNGMSGSTFSFTTGFEEDSTGPLFGTATLFDGQTAVPTNVRLSVRFDEPLSPVLTAGVQLQDAGGNAVSAAISFSSDRRTVTVVPRSLLAANSSYLLAVAGVQDISGNPLLVPVALTFTTGDSLDSVSGGIVNWSYAQSAVLPLNAVLEVELSERIDPTLVNTDPATSQASFALYSSTQGRFMRGHGELSADGRHLRFARDEALQAGHSYTLYVTYNTYLFDLAGNRLNGTSRGFTTSDEEDTTAPLVRAISVPDGLSGVPTNVKLNVRFSEPVNAASITGFDLRDALNNVVPTSLAFSNSVDLLTLNLSGSLAPSSNYRLNIVGIDDTVGNPLVVPQSIDFTTGLVDDTTRGNIVQWSFSADEILALDALLEVVLDKRVDPTSVDAARFYLWDESLNANVPGTIAVAADGITLTFDPAESLATNHQYRLYVSYSYFTDLAGNLINRDSRRFFTAD